MAATLTINKLTQYLEASRVENQRLQREVTGLKRRCASAWLDSAPLEEESDESDDLLGGVSGGAGDGILGPVAGGGGMGGTTRPTTLPLPATVPFVNRKRLVNQWLAPEVVGQGPDYCGYEAALLEDDCEQRWMGSFGDLEMIARMANVVNRFVLVVDPRTTGQGRRGCDSGSIRLTATMHTLALPCSLLVRVSNTIVQRLPEVWLAESLQRRAARRGARAIARRGGSPGSPVRDFWQILEKSYNTQTLQQSGKTKGEGNCT